MPSNSQPFSGPGNRAPTLWRHGDFMKLWAGQTISLFGNALSRLAIPLIAALTLNATPAEMGLLAAVGTTPILLVGLFAGVWVDRLRRRTLLIAGDIGRVLLLVTIPAAALLGILTMVQLYIVGFLIGVLTIFFEVASRSYLPTLISRHQLVEANGKLELSGSITAIAGPSLAGLVIQAITAPLAIFLDAASFLVSALCIFFVRHREDAPRISRIPLFSQIREGLGVVIGNPLLRALAGCLATSNFFSNAFFALYILFGVRELGLDAAELGLIYGLGASGALVGAMLAPRAAARLGVGRTLIIGAFLGSLEVLPVVFATPHIAIYLLLLSSLLGNFGWVLYNVNAISLRQAVTPIALQGRVNATFSFLVSGMLPLGALTGGVLGEVLGLRNTIILAAVGSLFATLWVLLSPARKMTEIPEVA
ncbi:MAG: MFS transporter [Coprothermobacterota bacterium]|nr:MFS transporter [Coprothermobacterota bacterium]